MEAGRLRFYYSLFGKENQYLCKRKESLETGSGICVVNQEFASFKRTSQYSTKTFQRFYFVSEVEIGLAVSLVRKRSRLELSTLLYANIIGLDRYIPLSYFLGRYSCFTHIDFHLAFVLIQYLKLISGGKKPASSLNQDCQDQTKTS